MSNNDWRKWILDFIRNDLRIIAIFLFVLLTLTYSFALMIGYAAQYGAAIGTPSQPAYTRGSTVDSDGDSLADAVESCSPPGRQVSPDGEHLSGAECTDTDPHDIDTDGDLFTDNTEDALGTDPNNPWDPGWVYIVWLLGIIAFIANKYIKGDPLSEYKKFEEQHSGGVAGKGKGKFAYSSSSIFKEKSASDMTEEERKQAIESDARFQRMTAEKQKGEPEEKPKRKRKINFQRLVGQGIVALFITIFIVLYIRAA